jgi:lipopolysaccharide export LptBFGC system permease protein LptF
MLQRYLLRETLSLYLLGVLLFVGLITFDLLSSLSGAFLRARTPAVEIIQMVAYRVPHTLGIALPLGLVFALLVALARWIRQSELKATYAAGVPPQTFIAPVLVLGVVVGAVVLLNEGWVKPIAQVLFEALPF